MSVLLMKLLKSPHSRDVRICVSSVHTHFPKDRNCEKPYLVLKNLETSQETQRSLQKFREPDRNPKVIYTDNSLEFGKACEDLSWNHCTSPPHRSETNGVAERAVRRVKEGTSAVLLQSGLNESWWADSMEWLHLSAKRHRFII